MEMSAAVGPIAGNSSGTDYLLLGFSENALVKDSDVVLGWVDDEPHLLDLHGNGNGTALLQDTNQNYELLSGRRSNGISRIKFRRKWNTCDHQDFHITDDTVRLTWAVGTTSLQTADFKAYFTNELDGGFLLPLPRASKVRSVHIRVNSHGYEQFPEETKSGNLVQPQPNVDVWDIWMNNTLNGERTLYLSTVIKFPLADNKRRHLIGFKPYIEDAESRRVHHMLFFGCHNVSNSHALDEYLDRPGLDHFSEDLPAAWTKHCNTIAFVWTIGSEGVMFPRNAGIPVSEQHNGCEYFLLQIHYDNPGLKSFTDHSGGRFYYTTGETQRKDDAALFSVAHRVSLFQLIPPKMESYTVKAFCTTECTYKIFPQEGITVSHVLLHGHLAATRMILRHIRNGLELPPLGVDNNYDPNYQEYRNIHPPRKILPGDELVAECTYNTIGRDNVTLGGIQATNEMCAAFLIYYPKAPIAFCTSQPEFHAFFRNLNVSIGDVPLMKKCNLPYDSSKSSFYNPVDDILELRHFSNTIEPADALRFINITGSDAHVQTLDHYFEHLDWGNEKWLESAIYGNSTESKHYAFCPGTTLQEYITVVPTGVKSVPVEVQEPSCNYL